MKKIKPAGICLLGMLTLFFAGAGQAKVSLQDSAISEAQKCFEKKGRDFSEVLPCYRQVQSKLPVKFTKISTVELGDDVEKRTYELTSQTWSPSELVTPQEWKHTVDIYVPKYVTEKTALVIVNNGTNISDGKNPVKIPTDFSVETLSAIASKTHTITISVSNVPNQYLTYKDGGTPKREDDSVAYSWKLFLDAPETNTLASLHIPMTEVVAKTMDLAEYVLKDHKIKRFIVAGSSKRGWATWFAAIVDSRVEAIVPFVIDILNTNKVLHHEYRTFGKAWPVAFQSYVRERIVDKLDTVGFAQLMKIEDPLAYLDTRYKNRLKIPKYIVNASGDSFFTPDNSQLYFDQLPGAKALRVTPNADHYDIAKFTESSLVPFVNRFQKSQSMPVLISQLSTMHGKQNLQISFSEKPFAVKQWTATNPKGRDFRYSCGIRYIENELSLDDAGSASLSLDQPATGWSATFVEAHFKDGMVATSQVYITPKDSYPDKFEVGTNPLCQVMQ